MRDSVERTYITMLDTHKVFSKKTRSVRNLPSLKEIEEKNATFLAQNTGYEQEVDDPAGKFPQLGYELSHIPEQVLALNRPYLASYFDRRLFTTPLRSVYAVSGAVRTSGETNEEYYRQSASRVR